MDQLLAQVKTYDFGDSREALTTLSDKIRQAYGKADELKDIEKGLLTVLASDAKYAGKQYVCRELEHHRTDQSVPVLAKMLTDQELSDMARYALERIPDKTVDPVLLAAMLRARAKQDRDHQQPGRARSPAGRREIGKLVDSSDKSLAGAAISALGKIGGMDAARA